MMPDNGADALKIRENIRMVQERIEAAAHACGRDPSGIALLAVSKFHPAQSVRAAYDAGLRLFGENRVQEAAGKFSQDLRALPGLRVHMIGNMQSNKAGKAARFFDAIQSVGSADLLEKLVRHSIEREMPLDLYLELHTAEDSKSGFADEDALARACEAWLKQPGNANLRGLMTMAPFTRDERIQRASFARLREARDRIVREFGITGMTGLSMGMSGDFEAAIREGSTMLRIGTLLFGVRE